MKLIQNSLIAFYPELSKIFQTTRPMITNGILSILAYAGGSPLRGGALRG